MPGLGSLSLFSVFYSDLDSQAMGWSQLQEGRVFSQLKSLEVSSLTLAEMGFLGQAKTSHNDNEE